MRNNYKTTRYFTEVIVKVDDTGPDAVKPAGTAEEEYVEQKRHMLVAINDPGDHSFIDRLMKEKI